MATQFVKWCKTKLHVGGCSYKTMTVLGSNLSDGRPSDTEDLVKDDTSSYNGAHINPCLSSPSCSENEQENHLDFEESPEVKLFQDFECDVQVEGNESGEEKKEFSFTFYDLDGYGKITKDDVAGLVRSIYGAVNESIKVPQGGKKTIKVKLTVSPEKSTSSEQLENINNNNNNNLPNSPMGNGCSAFGEGRPKVVRNNVNVTIQENLHRDRSGRKEKDLKETRLPKFHSVRIPNTTGGCRGCRKLSNFSPEVSRDCSASPLRNRKKWRERACTFHRPELIDLIQDSMEKNNVSPCCRHEHTHHPHSLSHCAHNQLNDPTNKCPSSLFRNESFWKQKLADITHTTTGCNRYPINLGVKVHECHIHKQSQGNPTFCKKHGHHRSKSHDLSQNLFKYNLNVDRDQLITQPPPPTQIPTSQQCCNNMNQVNNAKADNNHEDCVEIQHQQGCIINQHLRNKNTNITNSASPHQLKHRNREYEHARAMAQVISWLERENIGGDKTKFCSPKRKSHNPNNPLVESLNKKSEHHHVVHEHFHHHYHHYAKETPIIV